MSFGAPCVSVPDNLPTSPFALAVGLEVKVDDVAPAGNLGWLAGWTRDNLTLRAIHLGLVLPIPLLGHS